MANKILGARPVTVPTQVPKQWSFALAADKPPLFLLSRVEIGLFTVRVATNRNRVDGVVAAAEEIVAGIIAATDLHSIQGWRHSKCNTRSLMSN
jgi:hypothetical protein